MIKSRVWPLLLAPLMLGATAASQRTPAPAAPSPTEIVAAATAEDWDDITASDLVIMDLVPDRDGRAQRVVIQLLPPPFSQG